MCESLFRKHSFVMGGCDFSFGSYKPPARFQMVVDNVEMCYY